MHRDDGRRRREDGFRHVCDEPRTENAIPAARPAFSTTAISDVVGDVQGTDRRAGPSPFQRLTGRDIALTVDARSVVGDVLSVVGLLWPTICSRSVISGTQLLCDSRLRCDRSHAMFEAFFWGAVGASALLVGTLVAYV